MTSDKDWIEVRYTVPLGEAGTVELHLEIPVAASAASDRTFSLEVMDRVASFAQAVIPGGTEPVLERFAALVRSWDAEAAEIDVPDDAIVHATAKAVGGCASSLRTILADAGIAVYPDYVA